MNILRNAWILQTSYFVSIYSHSNFHYLTSTHQLLFIAAIFISIRRVRFVLTWQLDHVLYDLALAWKDNINMISRIVAMAWFWLLLSNQHHINLSHKSFVNKIGYVFFVGNWVDWPDIRQTNLFNNNVHNITPKA